MAVSYAVKIDDLYLTEDGNVISGSNKGCRLRVDGIELLEEEVIETFTPTFRPAEPSISQAFERGMVNIPLSINIESIPFDVLDDLLEIKADYKDDGQPVQCVLTHPVDSNRNYDLQVRVVNVIYSEFNTRYWRNVQVQLLTTGVTPP